MKRILKLAVLTVVVCCAAGPALADIPAHVDFWAEQTTANGGWAIHVESGLDPGRYNRYGYELPEWEIDPICGTLNKLRIDNQFVADNTKQLWVEIIFAPGFSFDKVSIPPTVTAYGPPPAADEITDITYVPVTGAMPDFTWSWIIFPQPAEEWVNFSSWITGGGSMASFDLDGDGSLDISKIEVGTYCVPTPPAVVLCLIGVAFAGIAGRFRRRK